MHSEDGLGRRATFVLVSLILAISTLTGTAYILWRLRTESLDQHREAAAMYARVFEDHLSHTFNVIDLTLNSVGDDPLSEASLTAALRRAPYLRSLAVIDSAGKIVSSSNSANIGTTLPRDDFLPADVSGQAILRVGLPWIGRDFHEGHPVSQNQPASPDAQTLIPLLRRVHRSDGTSALLLASVNPDYFLNYYGRNLVADPGFVEVLRYDGSVLFSTDPVRRPGSKIVDPEVLARMASEEPGPLNLDNEARPAVTAFRPSRAFPFAMVVSLDKDQMLVRWRREAVQTVAVIVGVLLVALAMAAIYFVRLERAARQHERDLEKLRLRSAALNAAANAIIITDRQGRIEWANPAFCAMSGYDVQEVLGRNPSEIVKSGKQTTALYRNLWDTILAGQVWQGEMINRRKNCETYPEDQTITPVRDEDGEIRHFIAVKQDITARRESEKRVEELSRHLVVVQESARRRLSGELHDRTSPNLAAIGVNLDIISASIGAQDAPELSARLEDVRALIEDTTASIREVCADLRPPVLDYAGLVAALESYIKQFQRRTGIVIRFECDDASLRLSSALESVLFRIAQEALTNCAKHSRARLIVVRLFANGKRVLLSVQDDGSGFDPDVLAKTTHTGGLGILTMREMAEFSGGTFTLEAAPGRGARIQVEFLRGKDAHGLSPDVG